ncbi:hypothetical protein D3C86_1313870 [compost metagenome]
MGFDLIEMVKGDRIGTGEGVPDVGPQIGFQRPAADLVATLEACADAAGPGTVGIERDMGDAVVLAVEFDLLVNRLGLGFDHPVTGHRDRVSDFCR